MSAAMFEGLLVVLLRSNWFGVVLNLVGVVVFLYPAFLVLFDFFCVLRLFIIVDD